MLHISTNCQNKTEMHLIGLPIKDGASVRPHNFTFVQDQNQEHRRSKERGRVKISKVGKRKRRAKEKCRIWNYCIFSKPSKGLHIGVYCSLSQNTKTCQLLEYYQAIRTEHWQCLCKKFGVQVKNNNYFLVATWNHPASSQQRTEEIDDRLNYNPMTKQILYRILVRKIWEKENFFYSLHRGKVDAGSLDAMQDPRIISDKRQHIYTCT